MNLLRGEGRGCPLRTADTLPDRTDPLARAAVVGTLPTHRPCRSADASSRFSGSSVDCPGP